MKDYEQIIGDLTVYASEPSPRFVDIHYRHGNQIIRTMTISDIRNLVYMLERVIEVVDQDED